MREYASELALHEQFILKSYLDGVAVFSTPLGTIQLNTDEVTPARLVEKYNQLKGSKED